MFASMARPRAKKDQHQECFGKLLGFETSCPPPVGFPDWFGWYASSPKDYGPATRLYSLENLERFCGVNQKF